KARAARNVMKADHTVAYKPSLDISSNVDNSSRNLVAQYLRRTNKPMRYFLHIGPADSAGCNPYQNLTVADSRYGNLFSHDLSQPTIDSGAHLERDSLLFRFSSSPRFGVLHFAPVRAAMTCKSAPPMRNLM